MRFLALPLLIAAFIVGSFLLYRTLVPVKNAAREVRTEAADIVRISRAMLDTDQTTEENEPQAQDVGAQPREEGIPRNDVRRIVVAKLEQSLKKVEAELKNEIQTSGAQLAAERGGSEPKLQVAVQETLAEIERTLSEVRQSLSSIKTEDQLRDSNERGDHDLPINRSLSSNDNPKR